MKTKQLARSAGVAKAERAERTGSVSGVPAAERLQSLDVLRGFDMFWISGGEGFFLALAKATGWAWAVAWTTQLDHVPWAGFHFMDLIFPLFVFISGVTLPMMVERRLGRGESRGAILVRLARRALLLVLLGVIINTGAISFNVANLRLGSVLGRIGLASLGAGVIVLYCRPRVQIGWMIGILLLYWALLTLVPVPGQGGASLDQGKNLVDFIDQRWLPGKLYRGNHDPEGLLSTLPAVASALLGALAGVWLTSARGAWRKTLGLIGAGLVLLGLGWFWGLKFPIIKNLWTSSFVLFAAGWSCLLLAAAYAVIDGIRWRRWALPFLLIGMNPLTLYLLRGTRLIDFPYIGKFLFGWATSLAPPLKAPLYSELAMMAVQLVFLYWLYRKKVFLRV